MLCIPRVVFQILELSEISKLKDREIVGSVDLYDFLVNGDNSSDINLHPNDVVLVGPAKINIQVRGSGQTSGNLRTYWQ